MDGAVAGKEGAVEGSRIANGEKAQAQLGHEAPEDLRDPGTAVNADDHFVESQVLGPDIQPPPVRCQQLGLGHGLADLGNVQLLLGLDGQAEGGEVENAAQLIDVVNVIGGQL